MSRLSRFLLLSITVGASASLLSADASAQTVPDSTTVLKATTLEVQLQGDTGWVAAQLTVAGNCHAVRVQPPNSSGPGPSTGGITHLFDRVERARVHLDAAGQTWTMVPDPVLSAWRQCQGELPH